MEAKTVSIPLPLIEGVELKSARVDLERGIVIAEYGQEDLYRTVKKGDFLTCLSDPSKTVIFNSIAPPIGEMKVFTILYDLPMQINGEMAYTMRGVKFPFSNFRYSTEEEKAVMIGEMEKLGKRYNPRTFEIEDIESIKTFKDLKFETHPILLDDAKSQATTELFANSKHAVMEFENGYGVSVIFGEQFYSNGIDNYEVAVLKDGFLCHETYITDNVVAYTSEDGVTEIMRKVQELNK